MFVNIHFSLIRTIAPLVLAQLLIQFQKPIALDNQLINGTNALTNHSFNDIALNRSIRSAVYDGRDMLTSEHKDGNFKLFAPDYPTNGE